VAKIYTRKGDDGTTGLIGGRRVPKDSPRIEAGGSVDELNAALGVARSYSLPERVDKTLQDLQNRLSAIGTEIAAPEGADPTDRQIRNEDVQALEKEIDFYEEQLTPLRQFILPGGTNAGAVLHLARAVARRAERQCVALMHLENINPRIVHYLNRLSDLCFVLARFVNRHPSASAPPPDPEGSGE
jgi:cob(I)alamin adenosyltransferase